jgi:ParB-like nuclease domain
MTADMGPQATPERRRDSEECRMSGTSDCKPRFGIKDENITVQTISISKIKPNSLNSRTHSAKQIRQIANSIVAFGFTNPLLLNENGELIAGHGRYQAAKQLGLAKVPVIIIAGLSPAKQRALAIADNKIAENAGWDRERLAIEIPDPNPCGDACNKIARADR